MFGSKPVVPPMKNVVGNTHAETRVEIAARARAEQAAQAAALAALEEKANKKSPISLIFALVFGFLAAAAIGFAIYQYTENDKLKAELENTKSLYSESQEFIDKIEKDKAVLKTQNTALQAELDALKHGEETEEGADEQSQDQQGQAEQRSDTPPAN
ncbi:hypothetical protein IK146_02160 [Candidatus Saccharibacteria bacterium]|nr:hypothetical protein [Candidatus Saccharibacteria bacterium]